MTNESFYRVNDFVLEHVPDTGESIVAAGMRELKEETNLDVGFRDSKLPPWTAVNVLGLWESCYPYELGLGLPQRHHVVIYLHCRSPLTAEAMNDSIKVRPFKYDLEVWN
jgi:8-oxo-dGTP pyrophosphatase MutT (NUDIX family)